MAKKNNPNHPKPKKWGQTTTRHGKRVKLPKSAPVIHEVLKEYSEVPSKQRQQEIYEMTKRTKRPTRYEMTLKKKKIRMLDFNIYESHVWPGPWPEVWAKDLAKMLEDIKECWQEEYITQDGIMFMPDEVLLAEWDVANNDHLHRVCLEYFAMYEGRECADERLHELRQTYPEWDLADYHYIISYILNEHQVNPDEV